MKVLKFGGTSVGSSERVRQVKEIILSGPPDVFVVFSAFRDVTDHLHQCATFASESNEQFEKSVADLEQFHISMVNELFEPRETSQVLPYVKITFNELSQLLHSLFILKELTPKTLDYILSFGERLSTFILSHYITPSKLITAEQLIQTDNRFGKANVLVEESYRRIREKMREYKGIKIVPGFVGMTQKGETTTLGRGGSDLTASVIAAAIEAEVLENWTDVDGFMTADPRMVESAYPIERLSYSEAAELSHFGAKVLYTPSLWPVIEKNIPVVIKNTFNPSFKGTTIQAGADPSDRMIKGISSFPGISLLNVQGSGMVGQTGISERLYGALAKDNVNVILISQASSEYSISIAVTSEQAQTAKSSIEQEFQKEIFERKIAGVSIEDEQAIMAIVGENMIKTPGIAGRLFQVLGLNGVNIVAIAQGSSERNISFVIHESSVRKALNVIHEAFFLSDSVELNLYLVGTGKVGESLVRQMQKQHEHLLREHNVKITLRGIANSRKMLLSGERIALDGAWQQLDSEGIKSDLDAFLEEIFRHNMRNSIFVDCTASSEVASVYDRLFRHNVSVVTANKIACSSEYDNYKKLKELARKKGSKFYFETNVGAGLPIIGTLNDLLNSGDHILKLEAVLSGTLNFIFNTVSEEIPLSKALEMAGEKGYLEPDPRIDLMGVDVLRKLLILSRECGYKLEEKDVEKDSFLPDPCSNAPDIESFFLEVKAFDTDFEKMRQQLVQKNKKWRFVASLNEGKGRIGLMEVDKDHPFYDLEDSNNLIMITTERYQQHPMIIKGYGAGAEVTAAGVFADIIKVVHRS